MDPNDRTSHLHYERVDPKERKSKALTVPLLMAGLGSALFVAILLFHLIVPSVSAPAKAVAPAPRPAAFPPAAVPRSR